MPSEHINGAAISVVVERDLDRGLPTQALQLANDVVDQRGVCLVEQSIETLTAPPDSEVDVRAERVAHPIEVVEIDVPDQAALHLRDERSRQMASSREIDLAPPESDANRANRASDAERVHGARSWRTTLIGRLRQVVCCHR